VPLSGSGWNNNVIVNGKKLDTNVNMTNISAGYFKTMGTPLLAGRDFDERDSLNAPKVAIVNQAFARKIFGAENVIGRTFQKDVYEGESRSDFQIVGVVRNTKYYDLREDFEPIAFYPQTQDDKPDPGTEIIVRSNLELLPLMSEVKDAIGRVNGGITIDFHPFSQQIKDGLLRERLLSTLSSFFGVLAGILAVIGLYGVIAYMVVRRTNEIGIRMALGARPAAIVRLIIREGTRLLVLGLIIGAALSVLAARAATALLFGLKPYDPLTLVLASLVLATAALAASVFPARRAARLDPMAALREE
jgi:predicted permease